MPAQRLRGGQLGRSSRSPRSLQRRCVLPLDRRYAAPSSTFIVLGGVDGGPSRPLHKAFELLSAQFDRWIVRRNADAQEYPLPLLAVPLLDVRFREAVTVPGALGSTPSRP